MKGILLTAVLVTLLSGCARPIPTYNYIDDKIANKVVNTEHGDESDSPTTTVKLSDMDNLKSKEDLKKLIHAGQLGFRDKSASLYTKIYNSSDVAYGGSLLAIVGGATNSVETVVTGAALGALGSIGPSRYKLNIQANNYKRIATAYSCILKEVAFTEYFDQYPDLMRRDAIQTVVYTLSDLEHKLFEQQSNISLEEVDIDALVEAVNTARSSTDQSNNVKSCILGGETDANTCSQSNQLTNNAVNALSDATKNNSTKLASATKSANDLIVYTVEKKALLAEVKACAAKF